MKLYFRQIISTITLIAFLLTLVPVDLFAEQHSSMLSPWLALHSGAAKRLMYFALRVPRLVYAESEHANALLERYHADALLLQNGSYLVDKSIFGHNEKVIGLFAKRDIGGILRETETEIGRAH